MAEQPVIFSATIENLINQICKEQSQQPLDHLARQGLAAIEEQQAFTLLTNISKCKITKSLNAYVMYMLKQPRYSHSPSSPSPWSSSTLSPSQPYSLSAPPSTPPPVARASSIHNTNTSRIQLPKKERLFKILDFPQQELNTILPHISTLEANHLVDNHEMVFQNPQNFASQMQNESPSPLHSYETKIEPLNATLQEKTPSSPIVSDGNLHDCLTLSSTHLHFPSFDNFVEELRHKVTNIRNLNKSAINPYIIADQWKNCIAFVNDWMNTNVECGKKLVEKNISWNSSAQIIEPITELGIPNPRLPTVITMEEPAMNFTPPIQSKPVKFFATKEDLDNLEQIKQSQAQIQHSLDLLLSKFC